MGLLAAAGSGLLAKPASALVQPPAPGSETPSNFEHPPGSAIPPSPFRGTRASLKNYEIPDWFRDAKFGMWAHWGPQSAIEQGDWYARNMYIQGSPQYNYHVQRYGHPSKFGYQNTIPLWKAEKFDPVALITQGKRNKEIASQIGTTEQVVKNYLRKIYEKLGVSDRLELALYCLHHQLDKKAKEAQQAPST